MWRGGRRTGRSRAAEHAADEGRARGGGGAAQGDLVRLELLGRVAVHRPRRRAQGDAEGGLRMSPVSRSLKEAACAGNGCGGEMERGAWESGAWRCSFSTVAPRVLAEGFALNLRD